MPRLLSGKVGVTSFAGLSTTRNQTTSDPLKFLGVGDMEPNLGLPQDNDYILFGNTDGTRRWDVFTPSGAVDGITVLDENITPSGFAGSITKLNFEGNGVTVTQLKDQVGDAQIGVATVFINKSTNDAKHKRLGSRSGSRNPTPIARAPSRAASSRGPAPMSAPAQQPRLANVLPAPWAPLRPDDLMYESEE